MQKHEVINAIVEHGYNLEKMEEYGTVYFGKTILRGDDAEVHKVVEIQENSKGNLWFHFYKTRKLPHSEGHQLFGDSFEANLDEIRISDNGIVMDGWFNEYVL